MRTNAVRKISLDKAAPGPDWQPLLPWEDHSPYAQRHLDQRFKERLNWPGAIDPLLDWLASPKPHLVPPGKWFKTFYCKDRDGKPTRYYLTGTGRYMTTLRTQEMGAKGMRVAKAKLLTVQYAGQKTAASYEEPKPKKLKTGLPTVCKGFHGTAVDFEEFDASFLGTATDSEDSRAGFWFSRGTDRAKEAARDACIQRHDGEDYPKEMPVIMECRITMQNPLVWPRQIDDTAEVIAKAKEGGHDGVIFVKGEGGRHLRWDENYLVWNPSQVKVLAKHKLGEVRMPGWSRSVTDYPHMAWEEAQQTPKLKKEAVGPTTDSPAFKAWFGASKVVDKNGEPVPLFHGTTHSFDTVEIQTGAKDCGWYGLGFYMTADPNTASAYAEYSWFSDGTPAHGNNVMRLFAKLVNPYYWPKGRRAATDQHEARAISEELRAEGYDGVIVSNEHADAAYGDHYEVVAFEPSQVKSAIGNNGNFDPADHRITASQKPFKFGNVQANIPEDTDAYHAVLDLRSDIPDEDLAGKGKRIGPTHVTVRYGIQTDDTSTIEAYLSRQAPMTATLGATTSFPPSESSEHAAVVIAPVECPELFSLNERLADVGDFTEPTFDYKPHATVAYVKPEVVERYVGNDTTEGKTFTISEVTVISRDRQEKVISLNGKPRDKAMVEPALKEAAAKANTHLIPKVKYLEDNPYAQVSEGFWDALKTATNGQILGTLDDFLEGPLRKLYAAALTTPVMALTHAVEKGQKTERADMAFHGAFGKYKGRPMIFINPKTDQALETLLEEAAHAMRGVAGRTDNDPTQSFSTITQEDHDGQVAEQSAARMVSHAQELMKESPVWDHTSAVYKALNAGIEPYAGWEKDYPKFKELLDRGGFFDKPMQAKAASVTGGIYYHGGPDIQGNVLKSGQSGAIFFTKSREYATQYIKNSRSPGVLYQITLDFAGKRIFDPENRKDLAGLKRGFLAMVKTGEYDNRADALSDYSQVVKLDLMDWATASQYMEAVEAAGYHGMRMRERPGSIGLSAEGGFTVSGEPIESVALFDKEIRVHRADPQPYEKAKEAAGEPISFPAPTGNPATNTPGFKSWFAGSKVVDANGAPLRVYRGDFRGDLLGDKFKVNKSTSGRFYFTDDPAIASRYAQDKPDHKRIEENDTMASWFKFPKHRYPREKWIPNLIQVWFRLTPEEKQSIQHVIENTSLDHEGDFDFEAGQAIHPDVADLAPRARGNWLQVAHEIWLESGSLFNEEHRFSELLNKAGVHHEFDDPSQERSAVTPVYLSIKHPLDTSAVPQEVIDWAHAAAKTDRSRPKQFGVDQWDKSTFTIKSWTEKLDEDLANGTTMAWTVMPEKVTTSLQAMGYDGVKDSGGKNGGDSHTVWIAFEPNQIKSAIGNNGKFDPKKDSIVASVQGKTLHYLLSPRA